VLLIAEKVRIPGAKRHQNPFRPRCAEAEDVQKYDEDQIGGPNKADILMAWNQPLSSAWNLDVITLLAEKAQQSLETGATKYDKSWLKLPELTKQITISLRETKSIMNPSSTKSPLSAPAAAARQRRRARKMSVSMIILQACKQLR
jgi:hypothetical protein